VTDSQATTSTRSTGRRVLVLLGKVAAVLAVLAIVCFILLWYTLQQSFRAPEGVAAPVSWVSQRVLLSAERPLVRGSLTLTATSSRTGDLRIGVNAGTPSSSASDASSEPASADPGSSPGPGAILLGPLTRLTATVAGTGGSGQSCLAPCELQLSSLDCTAGTCRSEFVITVELVEDRVGGVVAIDISGGASARIDQRLPDGLEVELAVGDLPVPAPT
jgi:hypothetical protein